MPPPPLVSLIMVTWNSKKHLTTCLNHLLAQEFHNFELVIVDNGSEDGILDVFDDKYSSLNLQIHKLDSNRGFAVANNIGVRSAKGKWVALLNADAYPKPAWLKTLVDFAESHEEFISFSSRQIQANHPDFLDGAGDAYHVSGLAWKKYIGFPSQTYGKESVEAFSPCAAAAMYLREAFLEVGGFDEDFFSYFEDVDLGFRLRLKGYKSMYVADAVVHHVGSASFGAKSDFALYHTHRNLIWSYCKNMPALLFWLYLPQHLILNLIYLFYYALRSRGKVLWKAKWDAIMGLTKVLQKRRVIQSTRRVSNKDLLASMQRGWLQPYLLSYRLRQALKNS